jgi:hypothetical protein
MGNLAFYTTGDTRPLPAVSNTRTALRMAADRSEIYRRYATALVQAENVIGAANAAEAAEVLRARDQAAHRIDNVYFIGHGDSTGFAFGVVGLGSEVSAPHDRMLVSPMRRGRGTQVEFLRNNSFEILSRLSRMMQRAPGVSRLEVRACHMSEETMIGFAGAMRRVVPDANLVLVGWTDFYAVIERSDGSFGSEIQRDPPPGSAPGTIDVVSSARGTHAPRPQLQYCVRDGQVLDCLP